MTPAEARDRLEAANIPIQVCGPTKPTPHHRGGWCYVCMAPLSYDQRLVDAATVRFGHQPVTVCLPCAMAMIGSENANGAP